MLFCCWLIGFIMMTPQLFINYKLKSVAHLPWRMMTYKALNTFIDDLFAFVIKMPTLYRIGCFRDGMYNISRFLPLTKGYALLSEVLDHQEVAYVKGDFLSNFLYILIIFKRQIPKDDE